MSSAPLFLPISYRPAQSRWPSILQAWLPVFLFACVFAIESTAAFGADHTSKPLHDFLQLFLGSSIDKGWSLTHHYIRKTGHFWGYGTLSLVCFRGFWLTLRRSALRLRRPFIAQLSTHVLAIAATFVVASADEIHQSFLPNRTGMFSDVILDTTGALALQSVLWVLLLIGAKRRAAKLAQPALPCPLKMAA